MRYLKVILLILLFFSCKSNRNNDVSIVRLPDGMQLLSGNYSKTYDGIHSKVRLIAYYDSTSCSSCAIKNLYAWANMVDIVERNRDKASIVFIFAPRKKDVNRIKMMLLDNMIDYPVYLDTAYVFRKYNNDIKNFPFYCIIDEEGLVKISGSPHENSNKFKRYVDVFNKEIVLTN